jgi:hypothetical protein
MVDNELLLLLLRLIIFVIEVFLAFTPIIIRKDRNEELDWKKASIILLLSNKIFIFVGYKKTCLLLVY